MKSADTSDATSSRPTLLDEDGLLLQYLPLPSTAQCLAAVCQNGLALQYVHEQTEEICLAAVRNRGMALQFVRQKTPEICRIAVGLDGDALQFVPEQTEELCLLAVGQKGTPLRFVRQQTPLLCAVAVESCFHALQYVQQQSTHLCLAAVRLHGAALRYVREQTPEICLAAVQTWGMALQYVREQTEEICVAAVRQYPPALRWVHAPTHAVHLAAVNIAFMDVLCTLPWHDADFATTALQEHPYILDYLSVKDRRVCLDALRGRGVFLPRPARESDAVADDAPHDTCNAQSSPSSTAVPCRSTVLPDAEDALRAVRNNGLALRAITEQTETLCRAAVAQNPQAMRYVKAQTAAVCDGITEYVARQGQHGFIPPRDKRAVRDAVQSLRDPDMRQRWLQRLDTAFFYRHLFV